MQREQDPSQSPTPPQPSERDSMRAYFAAAAMQGLLGAARERSDIFENPRILASRAFDLADAMVAASQAQQP